VAVECLPAATVQREVNVLSCWRPPSCIRRHLLGQAGPDLLHALAPLAPAAPLPFLRRDDASCAELDARGALCALRALITED
jgi:hypothetical protein